MPPIVHNDFSAETVILDNSNLIEASAGTGKTYSIAILTLRLIIEKNIPIKNILMVTFTTAAVAELEIRVRSFVRMALKVSRGLAITDVTITRMVNDQIESQGREKVTEKLAAAQLLLDETSVQTIHSFCQRTLSEFSFETEQIFGAETITPDEYNQILEDAFNEYWRKNVTTLRVDILKRLIPVDLKYKQVLGLVKQDLKGKLLYNTRPLPANFLSNDFQDDIIAFEAGVKATISNSKQVIIDHLIANKEVFLEKVKAHNDAKNAFADIYENDKWDLLIDAITKLMVRKSPKPPAYVTKIFGTLVDEILALQVLEDSIQQEFETVVNQIAYDAIRYVKGVILTIKSNRGIITFDDMIGLLYKAVISGNQTTELINSIRKKYDAIFIDEFQDTDREQYAIFDKLFGTGKILFYIGDPKQSIYAFRKADIFTYFTASNNVDHKHLMNTNHRSTAEYIEAMNEFFMPSENFDTFHFENDPVIPNAINYNNVGSPDPNKKGVLMYKGQPAKPIKISSHKSEKKLLQTVVLILKDLFTKDHYTIVKDEKSRPLQPSDLGILVRTKDEAKTLKSILTHLRIPAITIDDTRLLATNEATELFYILEAVNEISRSNINRALLSSIGGYSDTQLLTSDEETILLQFRTYQETWNNYGVYSMLKQFMADHDVYDRLFDNKVQNPERTISNVQQLIEILHKISVRKNYEPKELIQWLKKGMEGDAREGDEYEQRLESDQDAVQIVTIHKSKGLEYNIVIAPHLDLVRDKRGFKTASYRDAVTGEYYTAKKSLMNAQQTEFYLRQNEQENRRLLYVAITRARYQCFITANSGGIFSTSALRTFYTPLYQNKENLMHIEFVEEYEPIVNFSYTNPGAATRPQYAKAENFSLQQANWIKTSYSGLNPEHDVLPAPKLATGSTSSYDKFTFNDLKKGAHTGNLLHYIFEHIDFSDNRNWKNVVEQALKRLSGSADETYRDQILSLIEEVVGAAMPGASPFKLNEVKLEKRLNELEFDFLLSPFNTDQLEALSTEEHPFRIKSIPELEGIMNGKIDLFFEQDGKYYILDWKSNFLGNDLSFYGTDEVKAAMYENNYNLQYLIYTVALTKYLKLRNPQFDYDRDFGGVIYLFLRGVRVGATTGMYFSKPDKALIKQIKVVIGG